MVPVLSEHSTFMLPKFSIDARRLTMTFFARPCARAVGEVDADDRRQQLRREPDRQRQREEEGLEHRAVSGRR
jgi:predicted RNA-binding protein